MTFSVFRAVPSIIVLWGLLSGPAAAQLPPAPAEIKLPPAPAEIRLPPKSDAAGGAPADDANGLPPESESTGLPAAPEMTRKYPGNQVIEIDDATDPRIPVDLTAFPWRAVGRMKAGGGGSCTAALIGPKMLLTAAHCVFNGRTRDYYKPSELHFMLAYHEGAFTADARGARLILADDYDPVLNIGTVGKDWALIELDTAIGTPETILPLLPRGVPARGVSAALGGYANDMIENLMADPECTILGLTYDTGGNPLIVHNCAATQGVSGAPLLIRQGSEWLVGGIEVVGTAGGIGGAAVLHEVRVALEEMDSENVAAE